MEDATQKILDDFEKKMEEKFNAKMAEKEKEFNEKIASKDAEIELLKKEPVNDVSEIDKTIENNEMQKQIDALQETVNGMTKKLEKTEEEKKEAILKSKLEEIKRKSPHMIEPIESQKINSLEGLESLLKHEKVYKKTYEIEKKSGGNVFQNAEEVEVDKDKDKKTAFQVARENARNKWTNKNRIRKG